MRTKQQIISDISGYTRGFLHNATSIQRRINDLADIEFAAQEARETLEAVLDGLEDKREPKWFGYAKDGQRYFSESEDYADRNSTCMIAPLYDEHDKQVWLSGGN
jgi:hypothetical protein